MGVYSYHNEKVDSIIEKDLSIIKSVILKEIKPISIILFGGFGKGEGIVEIKKDGITPLNDYDLYIITDKSYPDAYIEKLGVKCSQAIGKGGLDFVENPEETYDENKFFHVDLRVIPYKNLRKLMPTQRTFELKHGSKIIYGKDVRYLIPNVRVAVPEAIRILFNKMDHLLLSKDNHPRIKSIYISKSYTDLCSALLIFENRFTGTYSARNQVFQTLDFPKELRKKVEWANDFRKNPKIMDNLDEEWGEAKYWVGYAFKYIIVNYLNLKDDSWNNIAKTIYDKLPYIYFTPYLKKQYLFPLQYYLTLRYAMKCWSQKEYLIKPLFSWKDVGIKLAVPLLLYLYDHQAEASFYLKKITNNVNPLRERLLKLYGLYYLQKII